MTAVLTVSGLVLYFGKKLGVKIEIERPMAKQARILELEREIDELKIGDDYHQIVWARRRGASNPVTIRVHGKCEHSVDPFDQYSGQANE